MRGSGGLRPRGDEPGRIDCDDRVVVLLVGQRVQAAQRDFGLGVHQRGAIDVRGMCFLVRPLLVKDRGRAPRAVEAYVGNGQVGCPVGAREGDSAVDECPLGGVFGSVRGELGFGSHGDGDGGAGGRENGHGVGGEGQGNTLPCPVLRVLQEHAFFDDLGQGLPTECVCARLRREVRQLHLEGPALRAVAQVGLGARGVGGPDYGRVHGRGRGRDRVNLSCADLARGVEGAITQLNVDERVGGSHEEVRDDRVLLRSVHAAKEWVGGDALAHEGADARDVRGGHGSAR